MKINLSNRQKKKMYADTFSPNLIYDPGILGENGAAVLKARFPRLRRARLSVSALLASYQLFYQQGF